MRQRMAWWSRLCGASFVRKATVNSCRFGTYSGGGSPLVHKIAVPSRGEERQALIRAEHGARSSACPRPCAGCRFQVPGIMVLSSKRYGGLVIDKGHAPGVIGVPSKTGSACRFKSHHSTQPHHSVRAPCGHPG
jgi:hypothetical protein